MTRGQLPLLTVCLASTWLGCIDSCSALPAPGTQGIPTAAELAALIDSLRAAAEATVAAAGAVSRLPVLQQSPEEEAPAAVSRPGAGGPRVSAGGRGSPAAAADPEEAAAADSRQRGGRESRASSGRFEDRASRQPGASNPQADNSTTNPDGSLVNTGLIPVELAEAASERNRNSSRGRGRASSTPPRGASASPSNRIPLESSGRNASARPPASNTGPSSSSNSSPSPSGGTSRAATSSNLNVTNSRAAARPKQPAAAPAAPTAAPAAAPAAALAAGNGASGASSTRQNLRGPPSSNLNRPSNNRTPSADTGSTPAAAINRGEQQQQQQQNGGLSPARGPGGGDGSSSSSSNNSREEEGEVEEIEADESAFGAFLRRRHESLQRLHDKLVDVAAEAAAALQSVAEERVEIQRMMSCEGNECP
ncbi:hypothetical protein Emag_003061 [Eimeria magna]